MLTRWDRRRPADGNPLAHGMESAVIHAPGGCEPGSAMWTNALAFESVAGLVTLAALPVGPDGRRCMAARTSVPIAARQLCEAQQEARVLQSSPAVHQHEDGEHAVPRRLRPHGQTNEGGHTDEAQNRG